MNFKHGCCIASLLFITSSQSIAGVYMGTGAETPADQQTVENLAPMAAPTVPAFSAGPMQEAQVVTPLDCEPYSGKGPMPAVPCAPQAVATVPQALVVTVRTGSLKDNIDRITEEAGWGSAIWKPNYDYNWVGDVTITASDVQGVLTKLLEPYPLQAVFYTANRVVEIVPRRVT